MKAYSLTSLAFVLAAPLLAAEPARQNMPEFSVAVQPGMVEFHVGLEQKPFIGIVLISLSSDLQHFLVGLPPLLDQAVILDWGVSTNERFSTRFPEFVFPPGVTFFAQGVTVSDVGILSSEVASFVLDATGGGGG